MRAAGIAVLLAASWVSPAALAQEPPVALMLTCSGTDTDVQATGSTLTVKPGVDPGIGSAAHRAAVIAQTATTSTSPVYGRVRVPARMSLTIQGESVRVRPSENTKPGMGQKKSADGWYDLSEVEITDTQIRARASFGGLLSGKYRLVVDRQTGDARFGDFVGVCEKAATGPTERKF